MLRCRNATQTSVVLEWDPIDLATAELRSLSLYRNGAKAGNIPLGKQSTKISGLALDTEYTFHLVLRTSAGQYSSDRLAVKTHKMTDLHGITVTPGVMAASLRDDLQETVQRIGAKLVDTVRIDTTHFVCTEPRGPAYEKALEMNVPVVVPDWVKGCEREGKIVGVRAYYLDADPSKRQIGPSAQQQQQDSRQGQGGGSMQVPMRDSPRIEHTPPTPEQARPDRGFPSPQRDQQPPRSQSPTNGAPPPAPPKFSPEPVQDSDARSTAAASSMAGTTLAEREVAGHEDDGPDVSDEDEEAKAERRSSPSGVGEKADVSDEEDDEDDGPKYTSVQEAADDAEKDGEGEEGEGKGGFDEVSL